MMRHCSIDIANGITRYARSPRRLDGLLKDAYTKRALPGEDILVIARDHAEKGFSVLTPGCDNVDATGRCAGHPENGESHD